MASVAKLLEPDYHYTYTGERRKADHSTSTLTELSIVDPTKTAVDYGYVDTPVTKASA